MSMTATVVVRGIVGTQPRVFKAKDVPGVSFRLASSRRLLDRQTNSWHDSPTTWISVEAFRGLAANVGQSLSKGDPVVVAGELTTQEWDRDGEKRSTLSLRASVVGHDLNRGVSSFTRVSGESSATVVAATGPGVAFSRAVAGEPTGSADGASGQAMADVTDGDDYPSFADGSFDGEDCVDEDNNDEAEEVAADGE